MYGPRRWARWPEARWVRCKLCLPRGVLLLCRSKPPPGQFKFHSTSISHGIVPRELSLASVRIKYLRTDEYHDFIFWKISVTQRNFYGTPTLRNFCVLVNKTNWATRISVLLCLAPSTWLYLSFSYSNRHPDNAPTRESYIKAQARRVLSRT